MQYRPIMLVAATAAVATLSALPAAARPATCSFAGSIGTAEGPCDFAPEGGGSFTATMEAAQAVPGPVRLEVTGGAARATQQRAGGEVFDAGPARRDPADAACWLGAGYRLCARNAPEGATAGAVRTQPAVAAPAEPVRFTARCHMGACTWIEQSGARQLSVSTDGVPGRLMEVTERRAMREYPGADYPASVPDDVTWSEPATPQYFCSTRRPALRNADGSWSVLPLPEVFGATEGATSAYLHVCHPGSAGNDPYAAIEGLGYTDTGVEMGTSYPDFDALISP